MTLACGVLIVLILAVARLREHGDRRSSLPLAEPAGSSRDAAVRERLRVVFQWAPRDGWIWIAMAVLLCAPPGWALVQAGTGLASLNPSLEPSEAAATVHRHLTALAQSFRETGLLWGVTGVVVAVVAPGLTFQARQVARAGRVLRQAAHGAGAEPLPTSARLAQLGIGHPGRRVGLSAAGVVAAGMTAASLLLWGATPLRQGNQQPPWLELWPQVTGSWPPAFDLPRHSAGRPLALDDNRVTLTESEVRVRGRLFFRWSELEEIGDIPPSPGQESAPAVWAKRRLSAGPVREALQRVSSALGVTRFRWLVDRDFPDRRRPAFLQVDLRRYADGPVLVLDDSGARMADVRFDSWVDPAIRELVEDGVLRFRVDTDATVQSLVGFWGQAASNCAQTCGIPSRDITFVWLPSVGDP